MIFTSRDDHSFTDESKKQAVSQLIDDIKYDRDFRVLLIGSILIATGALFADSIPVLIASMIIAPLASPILVLGLGVVARDMKVILHALAILGISCVIALGIAAILTLFFDSDRIPNAYISFTGNRTVAIGIAVIAGFVGAYGMLSTKVASAVTGVAIAVSLMPPLVATSVNFVSGKTNLAIDAGILFLLNVLGILIASMIVYWWFSVGKAYRAAKKI